MKTTAELVWLRRAHSALRDGNSAQVPLAHTNGQMAFARVGRDGAVAVVAMNNESAPARMSLPVAEKCGCGDGTAFAEPLASGATHDVSGGQLIVELPPNGYRVFVVGE